jgi:hypothetical protein
MGIGKRLSDGKCKNWIECFLIYSFEGVYVRRKGEGRKGWRHAVAGGVLLALLLPVWPCLGQSASVAGQTATESNPDLFSQVLANQKRSDANLNLFERLERVEIRKTGSDANPSEVKNWRVFPAGTGMNKIPLTAEGKPISPESYRAALEKLEAALVWAAETGAAQKEAYAKIERRKKERNDLIDATRRAFLFTRIGEEMRGDRVLVKYDMTRNPSFKPATRNEMLFTRIHGTLWIDKETSELAKIEGRVTEDISLALFLAKVYQGSYFMQERYEMASGVWLPTYQQYDFDGRKFVVPFAIHERAFYTAYRRVGPPKEAVEAVRDELSKLGTNRGDP